GVHAPVCRRKRRVEVRVGQQVVPGNRKRQAEVAAGHAVAVAVETIAVEIDQRLTGDQGVVAGRQAGRVADAQHGKAICPDVFGRSQLAAVRRAAGYRRRIDKPGQQPEAAQTGGRRGIHRLVETNQQLAHGRIDAGACAQRRPRASGHGSDVPHGRRGDIVTDAEGADGLYFTDVAGHVDGSNVEPPQAVVEHGAAHAGCRWTEIQVGVGSDVAVAVEYVAVAGQAAGRVAVIDGRRPDDV